MKSGVRSFAVIRRYIMADDRQPMMSYSCLIVTVHVSRLRCGDIGDVNGGQARFGHFRWSYKGHADRWVWLSAWGFYWCSMVTICVKCTVLAMGETDRPTDRWMARGIA